MSGIREAILQLSDRHDEVYLKFATVDSVDTTRRTCNVTPLDGSAPLLGVNLQANQSGTTGFVLIPAVGSHVAVSFLNKNAGCVVLTETVESASLHIDTCRIDADRQGITLEIEGQKAAITQGGIELEAGSTKATLTASGVEIDAAQGTVSIKNAQYSLAAALSDLTTALSVMTVPVMGTPTPPGNAADFIQIGTKIKTLLS